MGIEMRALQAVRLWHEVHLALVRGKGADLSSRQTAVLLTVYLEAAPHTVRGLARKLDVTKPVITRALDTLGKLDLLTRRRDETDRRNVIVQRTVAGALAIEHLADIITARMRGLPR
jgi:DNA-binding MarR family transcriptional regulator